ncbi:MAG: hypothetical protein BWY35_02323 [Firmicutes bacterium ADurb.Bin248]|nr:MAG: hypothetical protein BWY35_02323 [Firmicutes bacterium ADurb.Bin248]HPK14562.1 hypothetical protein [Clostridia bacterium]
MKNRVKLLALLIAALFFACACSSATGARAADERVWSDAQRIYRSSSLVVLGECVRAHLNEDGVTCYDLTVGEVLAGRASEGDLIHCADGAMKEGQTYLLYLADENSAVYYSEDASNYKLLTEDPLPVSEDGEVAFPGARLPLGDIRANIEEQNEIVSSPSETYYYKDLSALAKACHEIFIGRAADVPELSDTRFRSDSAGATIENALPAATLQVEVYGSLKGALRYGEKVPVVYCPALCDEMTDAATLKPLTYDAADAAVPVKGGVYLFFLLGSPDLKQDMYFAVNPIQGFAALDEKDRVHVTYLNRALFGYYSLDALVKDIRGIIDNS